MNGRWRKFWQGYQAITSSPYRYPFHHPFATRLQLSLLLTHCVLSPYPMGCCKSQEQQKHTQGECRVVGWSYYLWFSVWFYLVSRISIAHSVRCTVGWSHLQGFCRILFQFFKALQGYRLFLGTSSPPVKGGERGNSFVSLEGKAPNFSQKNSPARGWAATKCLKTFAPARGRRGYHSPRQEANKLSMGRMNSFFPYFLLVTVAWSIGRRRAMTGFVFPLLHN